jgi:hypothetical protein
MSSGNSSWLHIVLYAAIVAALYYYFMRGDKYRDDSRHIENSLLAFAAALAALVFWTRSRESNARALGDSYVSRQPAGGDGEGFR